MQRYGTHGASGNIAGIRGSCATVEPLHTLALKVFVWHAWVPERSLDDRVISRPKLEHHDVTGQSVDAVWGEVVLRFADGDYVDSDLVLDHRRCGGIDGSRGAVTGLSER